MFWRPRSLKHGRCRQNQQNQYFGVSTPPVRSPEALQGFVQILATKETQNQKHQQRTKETKIPGASAKPKKPNKTKKPKPKEYTKPQRKSQTKETKKSKTKKTKSPRGDPKPKNKSKPNFCCWISSGILVFSASVSLVVFLLGFFGAGSPPGCFFSFALFGFFGLALIWDFVFVGFGLIGVVGFFGFFGLMYCRFWTSCGTLSGAYS